MLTQSSERMRAISCHSCHENYENYLTVVVQHKRGKVGGSPAEIDDGPLATRMYDLVLKRKRFGIDVLAAPPWSVWSERYPAHSAELRRMWLLDRQIAALRSSTFRRLILMRS